MKGMRKEFVRTGLFHQCTKIHNADTAGYIPHHADIVGYEQQT